MKGHRTGTAGAENSIGIDQGRILDMRRIRLSRLKAGRLQELSATRLLN